MTTPGRTGLAGDRIHVETPSPGVRRIVFSAPGSLNAVDAQMLSTVAAVVEAAGRDVAVRVIVLTGRGRASCAGADLNTGDAAVDGGPETETVDASSRLTSTLVAVPKLVVCALNGLAAGAGVSIALACDLIVAHEPACF